MHRTHFNELIRDTDIAFAIRPVTDRANFSFAQIRDALVTLHVPRAGGIAGMVTAFTSLATVADRA